MHLTLFFPVLLGVLIRSSLPSGPLLGTTIPSSLWLLLFCVSLFMSNPRSTAAFLAPPAITYIGTTRNSDALFFSSWDDDPDLQTSVLQQVEDLEGHKR